MRRTDKVRSRSWCGTPDYRAKADVQKKSCISPCLLTLTARYETSNGGNQHCVFCAFPRFRATPYCNGSLSLLLTWRCRVGFDDRRRFPVPAESFHWFPSLDETWQGCGFILVVCVNYYLPPSLPAPATDMFLCVVFVPKMC